MALRFRFHIPWGFFLATAGLAALGAFAAAVLLVDFHGYLGVRVALCAAAAALLGGAGWIFSEYLTDAVNLHTSPLLRIALPGAAAVFLCTQVAGPFSELSVGVGLLWPELLCLLVYLVVGLPPLLGGIAVITGIEAALAARRSGSAIGESLRPIVRYLVIGAVLCSATIYVAFWLPQEVLRDVVLVAPDRTRESGWQQSEKRLFVDVQKNGNCEVLVVPFSGATPSVDRASRSLMMRYVSAELAVRSGLCVADPTLVARALGARARAPDAREVRKLADAMHASWVVHGTIALEDGRHAFSIALDLEHRDSPTSAWSAGQRLVWGPVEFSDELPPEAAFFHIAHAAVEQIGIPLEDAGETESTDAAAAAFPSTPAALANAAGTPVERARGLQLLAATYRSSELGGEHLWERSLIALTPLPAGDETARTLRARAALHLQRRPYALDLLQGLQSSEARALHALAQGNLLDAEKLASEVKEPAAVLALQLELEALRERYGRTGGQRERRRALLDTYPGYAALLYVPMSSADSFQPAAHELIRKALSESGVDVSEALVQLLTARVRLESRLDAPGVATAAAIEHSYAPVWRRQGPAWRAARAFDRVAVWDGYDALYAANRAALADGARATLSNANEIAALPSLANALASAYAGYPALQASVATALRGRDGNAQTALARERARRLPLDVLAWEGGETDVERQLRARVPDQLPVADADEPPRPWRGGGDVQTGSAESAPKQGASLQRAAAHYMRTQKYAWDSFNALEQAIVLQERGGQLEQVASLSQEATRRFLGDPARERYLLRRAEDKNDMPAYVALLQQKIREQPEQWPIYLRLATAYLRAREAAYAQQTLLAYPLFQSTAKGTASVNIAAAQGGTVSGLAAEAGLLLLSAGEAELARPLFSIAATREPDSAAGMWSRLSIAQIDGNWGEARARAAELHERFQAEGALARAASLSFVLDEHDAGWREFYEASKRSEDFTPWGAALDGHRIEATKPDELLAFAKRWKSLSGDAGTETRLKSYFLFNVLMMDRPVNDAAAQLLQVFAGQRQDSQLAALTAGYRAFKRGDYATVASQLEGLRTSGKGQLHATSAASDYLLPYIALALTQTGRASDARALLEASRKPGERGFYQLLAGAYIEGSDGHTDGALLALWDAFLVLPSRGAAMVPPGFQLLETCERLYALTHDDRYRALLVDLAQRQQRTWPVSWAYAYETRYAVQQDQVERALGFALVLDPQSELLHDFTPELRKRAANRFAKNNLFGRS